jgi:hypothetical protein
LLEAFHAKNQELVAVTTSLRASNTKSRDRYLTNVGIVARHRVELAQQAGMNAISKLEKQCGRGATLAELVRQAEEELERVKEHVDKQS